MTDRATLSVDEWRAEAIRRFGHNPSNWKFSCPVCGHVASMGDYSRVGAPQGAVGFSCIGRWIEDTEPAFKPGRKGTPCDYAGGGLFRLNPVRVVERKPDGTETVHEMFEFAEPDHGEKKAVTDASAPA